MTTIFRPWEASQCNPLAQPWEAINSPFMRTVEIHRTRSIAQETANVGNVGYSGSEQIDTTVAGPDIESETVLMTGVPASISVSSAGRSKGPLPADITYKPGWRILIQASAAPQYSIRDRDIVVDDEGYRYSIAAAAWLGSSAGYQLDCVRLEA